MSAFILFCQTAEAIGATQSRLEKAAILGDYFRDLPDDDLRRAALYFGGTPFPLRENRVVNIGGAALSSVTQSVSGADANWLAERLVKTGDAGETAFEAWEVWPDAPTTNTLTLAEIESALAQLAADARQQSQSGIRRANFEIGDGPRSEVFRQNVERRFAHRPQRKRCRRRPRATLRNAARKRAARQYVERRLGRSRGFGAAWTFGGSGFRAVSSAQIHAGDARQKTTTTSRKRCPNRFASKTKFDGIRAQAHIAPHRAHDEALHGENYGEVRVALFRAHSTKSPERFPIWARRSPHF